MTCANDRYGPTCERADPHDGTNAPHRNGLLVWHDPPLILVAGEPVAPLTDRERALLGIEQGEPRELSPRRDGVAARVPSRRPAPSPAAPVSSQIGVDDPWPETMF